MMLLAGVISLVAVLLLGLFVVVLGDDESAPPDSAVGGSGGSDTSTIEPATDTTVASQTASTEPTDPTTSVATTTAPTTAPPTTAAPTTVATTVAPTTAPPTTAAPTTAAPPTTPPVVPNGPAFARNPRFSLDVDEFGQPDPEVIAIADGETRICLTWDFFEVPLDIPLRVDWYVNGVFNTGFDGVNDVGALSGTYFACNRNPTGLPSGLHEIEWSADGTVVFRHGWYVGQGSIPMDIEFVNTTEFNLCDVNVSPQAATSFGIPLNRDPLLPGGSVVVTVPDGVYDVQATACNGTIVDEQYGIDIFGPTTIQF